MRETGLIEVFKKKKGGRVVSVFYYRAKARGTTASWTEDKEDVQSLLFPPSPFWWAFTQPLKSLNIAVLTWHTLMTDNCLQGRRMKDTVAQKQTLSGIISRSAVLIISVCTHTHTHDKMHTHSLSLSLLHTHAHKHTLNQCPVRLNFSLSFFFFHNCLWSLMCHTLH